MAIQDDVTSGFQAVARPILVRDSVYDHDDYGSWDYGSLAVGNRIFVFWTSAWYDGGGSPNTTSLAGWRIYDVAVDGTVTETDSWANYAQTFNGRQSFPLAGVQDAVNDVPAQGDIRMDRYGGDDRRNLAEAFNIVGENSEFHWIGFYFNASNGGGGGGVPGNASSFMLFKIRKSDGKLFKPDGTPGFPSVSNPGEEYLFIDEGSDGFSVVSPLMGPFRTSQGIVVGAVGETFGATNELRLKTYLIPFSDSTGITGTPVKNLQVMADSNGPLVDDLYGGFTCYYAQTGDVIVGVRTLATLGNSNKDNTLVFTVGASGQFLAIEQVTSPRSVDTPPYSAMTAVDGGIVIAGRFSQYVALDDDYTDGVMWDLPVEIGTNGSITAGSPREWTNTVFVPPVNFNTGSNFPPHISSLNRTGGRGAVGGFTWGGDRSGDLTVYGGYRIVSLTESYTPGEVVPPQYYEELIDAIAYPGYPVDTGHIQYPFYIRFPEDVYNNEVRSAYGTPLHGRYCYSIVFDDYRTTATMPGTNNTRIEYIFLGLWEVYQEPFRFGAFGTGPTSTRMVFGGV